MTTARKMPTLKHSDNVCFFSRGLHRFSQKIVIKISVHLLIPIAIGSGRSVRRILIDMILMAWLLMSFMNATAQPGDPEFRKGWLLNARLTNGAITNFHGNQPDAYVGGLGLNPQITVVPGILRAGANIAGVYGSKKTSGLFGPMVALKLKSLKVGYFGTIANLQLTGEANWGTNKQALAGGGLALEIAKLAHIGLSVQRDYRQSNWWLQSFIAIRLNKIRQEKDPYQ